MFKILTYKALIWDNELRDFAKLYIFASRKRVINMATQSFMKSFSVNKRNAVKVARVLNSTQKMNLPKDFTVSEVKREDIKRFLGMEK